MHQQPDMNLWQGRRDDDGERALRWHQQVRPVRADAQHGAVLVGFACDAGVVRNQGRPGAADGPAELRRALGNLAWQHGRPVYDAGDVCCEGDMLEAAQAEYAAVVENLLAGGHLPVGLGGGHEIAWAAWQGLAQWAARQERVPRVGILNFDAHFDLRFAPQGNSGTPFRQIAEDCLARGWDFRYGVLGIAQPSNTEALFDRARELGVVFRLDEEMRPGEVDNIASTLHVFLADVDWLYLTICLDVLPAAYAPGVSAPAALGVDPFVVEAILDIVKTSGKIRLADVAELNPRFDEGQRTSRLAARLVWRLAR